MHGYATSIRFYPSLDGVIDGMAYSKQTNDRTHQIYFQDVT